MTECPDHRTSEDPRPIQSRRALLDAATGLLLADGPAAVTVDALVRRAKISRATMYRHYPHVKSLVAAAFLSQMPGPPATPDVGTVRERLIEVVAREAEILAESPMLRAAVWWVASMRDISDSSEVEQDRAISALRSAIDEVLVGPISAVMGASRADPPRDPLIVPLLIAPIVAVDGRPAFGAIEAAVGAFLLTRRRSPQKTTRDSD